MLVRIFVVLALAMAGALGCGAARADGSGDPTAVKQEDGKYLDKEGDPTYKIQGDGTVDWYTYSGYRRYHSECHVCYGPDGEGSTYAPALKNSAKTMSYPDFLGVVAGGVVSTFAWAQGREPPDVSIELVDPSVFRVCADPHNLPFSNEQGEGFE